MLKAVIYICCDTKLEDNKATIECHFDNFCKSLGKFWMKFSVVFVTLSQTGPCGPGVTDINVLVFYVQKSLSSLAVHSKVLN